MRILFVKGKPLETVGRKALPKEMRPLGLRRRRIRGGVRSQISLRLGKPVKGFGGFFFA
jgi:hypothetical protein